MVGSDSLVFGTTRDAKIFAVTDRLVRQLRVEGGSTVEQYIKSGKLELRVEQGAIRTKTYKLDRPTDTGLLSMPEIVSRSQKLGSEAVSPDDVTSDTKHKDANRRRGKLKKLSRAHRKRSQSNASSDD